MKAVHAAGGVHIVRSGGASADDRLNAALAATLRKTTPSPAFLIALEKARTKARR
jgi:hypothetical protein